MEYEIVSNWTRFLNAVNSEVFVGPFITPNHLSGEVGPGLTHSGLSLEISTPDFDISAPILRATGWTYWGTRQAVIRATDVRHDILQPAAVPTLVGGIEVISMSRFLGEIFRFRRRPFRQILELLMAVEPLFDSSRCSPLKRNAQAVLAKRYNELGFAAAPVKLTRQGASIRLVWIYPHHRRPAAVSHYLTVGFARFQVDTQGEVIGGNLEFPWFDEIGAILGQLLDDQHVQNPVQLLSEVGRNEIRTKILARANGGHDRTKFQRKREEFILQHQELWGDFTALAKLMKQHGLYSQNTADQQIAFSLEFMVHRKLAPKDKSR